MQWIVHWNEDCNEKSPVNSPHNASIHSTNIVYEMFVKAKAAQRTKRRNDQQQMAAGNDPLVVAADERSLHERRPTLRLVLFRGPSTFESMFCTSVIQLLPHFPIFYISIFSSLFLFSLNARNCSNSNYLILAVNSHSKATIYIHDFLKLIF